jgi:hypothetical protein
MLDDREWMVPFTLVRHADRMPLADCSAHLASPDPERVTVLRARVKDGFYASASMMDAVARRILARGDT